MVIKLKTKYLIIGAGISGLTFANYCDGSYIIVEKENEVGGYCRTIKRNGYIWDYAGHFFHFKTKEFKDLFLKQISDRDIVYNDKCTKILYKDKLIDFPFQSNIHQLDKEEFIDCLYDLFNKNEKKKYDNFLDMLYGKFGKSIVEKFLKPYNEKLYAINLEELDVEAMGRFFPYANKEEIINNMKNKSINSYNSSFLYPKNGAASFIDILYNKLDKEKILLNTEINKIDLAKKKAILSNGKEIEYKYLINTSPFNKFLGIFNKYDKLISEMSYNKVLVFNMGFDKPSPLCKEEHWIYLPDKKTNYYRIGFYNNILCNDKLSMYIEIGYNKSINIETRMIAVDDDLFALSKNMEQYRGYHVNDIDPIKGTVSFTNGEVIRAGEVVGDISEKDLRRIQIRETIRSHFEKEKQLYEKGIKTLSLFFIDEVAKYRKYDDDGNELNSEYGEIFEQEYTDILNEYLTIFDTPYEQYLRGIEVEKTHAGYFSIDKKGRKIDSTLKRGSDESDDISAYDLILKDKERLLSFDNPVRFIFSHSALREGWDNPNVFQICTLKHGGSSPTQKRQEVGRGLRLCVNQYGDRMDSDMLGTQVQQINQLTVIASDGYKDFVADLQKGIRDDLYERPTKATFEYFYGKTLILDGKDVKIDDKQARDIYRYLVRNDYIDDEDQVTDQYRTDLANDNLAVLPESCTAITEGVHALIQSVFDKHALDNMITDGHDTKIQENALNDNFYKKEFQTLWNYINHKYAYTVEFDSEELIGKSIKHINDNLFVSRLQYTITTGTQEKDLSADQVNNKTSFVAEKSRTEVLNRAESSQVPYDLIGKIAEGTKLTRKTAARILAGLMPHVFKMFRDNPEEFITKVIRLINEQKATAIVEQISYNRTDGVYDSAIFTAERNTDFAKAYKAKKNVQDYVFTDGYARDGQSVERKFAQDMDLAEEVCVYAKLPKGFAIPTPVGNYSPDWAIAFNKGAVKHIFFIAETKGSMDSMNLKPIEQAKISCAKKLFNKLSTEDVVYHEVKDYQTLLSIIDSM